jgi:hypothetical protein
MTKIVAIHRIARAARAFLPCLRAIEVIRPYLRIAAILLAIVGLTGCATTSRHQFVEPAGNWQTRSGQLMYRTAQTTLVGDVLVRFSESGDFELTVSKGPGVTLLSLRQDASFAEVKGPFAEGSWSGPVEQAPKPLRGWLGLRDKLIHSKDRSVRYTAGNETFLFRF